MKIALVHNLPSGGARRATIEHCRGLRARGHAIEAFVPETADEAFLPTSSAVDRVHLWPVRHASSERRVNEPGTAVAVLARARLIPGLPAVYRQIAAAIDSGGFDVVFATHDQFTQAPDVLRHLSTPSIYYCHEPLRIVHDERPGAASDLVARLRRNVAAPLLRLLGSVDARAARAADRVIVNSAFTAESVRRAYGIEARVVHPAVDPGHFRPLGLPREDFVLSVGSLHPEKGHDFVVEALARLPAERRPRLVVVADRALGGFRPKFDALVAKSGVAVEVTTRVSENDLVALYNRAIATVYAARLEPFGLVPLESMACGTPVIAVAEGGVLETMRDGANGRIVARDADALALAIDDADPRERRVTRHDRDAGSDRGEAEPAAVAGLEIRQQGGRVQHVAEMPQQEDDDLVVGARVVLLRADDLCRLLHARSRLRRPRRRAAPRAPRRRARV